MGEIGRKTIHILFGSLFIVSAVGFGGETAFTITCAALIAGIMVSNLIAHGLEFPVFSLLVELFERDNDRDMPGKGAIMFFAGAAFLMFLALFVFQRGEIIAPALVPLVFGDGIAAIAGKRWGKHEIINGKTVEGTLAGFTASCLALALFLPSWTAVIAVSAVAMAAELLPLDDNFSMPVAAGIVLYIIF
ncbi:MAG: SEC59/DGK1/VTE5 family protein [Candidatus Diapherotrites archaeon]|nr:SEC59/DGK1/VTE5 family protein [Candidatus Diapherotrites archaeon]